MNLKITIDAYYKLKYFTENVDGEISGLGKVRELSDCLEVYDIEIFEQRVSGISSNLDTEILAKFLTDKAVKNESVKDYKVWWHSHSSMDSFFSVIDETTIDQSSEFPYLVSIVINKKSKIQARLDIFEPIRLIVPLEIEMSFEENKEIEKQCQKEISEKVKNKSFWPSISRDRKKYSTPKFSKPPSTSLV